MSYKVSSRRSPEHQGQPSLFEGTDEDHDTVSDESKATNFLSRFQYYIKPFSKYSNYFNSSGMDRGHICSEIKRHYIDYVLGFGWSERKYVYALEYVFFNNKPLLEETVYDGGMDYDCMYQ
jgi:hypothetical protein